MTDDTLLCFDDGSAVHRDPSSLELRADPGVAALALRCASFAVERSAAEANTWFHGAPAEGAISARPLSEDTIELRAGEARAAVSLPSFRAVLFEAYAQQLAGETFWLFRSDPVACTPSSGDRQFVAELEPRARDFDALLREGALDEETEQRRRRVLLAELRQGGLTDPQLLERKIEVLQELGLATLVAMASAARALWAYAASPERAREVRAPPWKNLETSPFSLDWARSVVSAPPGFTLFEWWAACESSFLPARPAGARGRAFLLQGRVAAELKWRSEDGARVALYDVEFRSRRNGS